MIQKKNSISTEELIFKEEVPDEELHSKIDVDDHIYVTNDVRRITGFLIFLAVSLILTSLLATLFGIYSLDKSDSGREIGVSVTKYNLVVSHSNSKYGADLVLADYNTVSNAYSYDFSVNNTNPVDLNYSVDVSSSGVDPTLVNYRLIVNGEVVKSGKLSDKVIYDTKIIANSKDDCELKVWSEKSVGSFSFSVNILV